jgi:hypothetical protein
MKMLAVITGLVLSACASHPSRPKWPSDWGPYTLKLQQGMSEYQAIWAIGFQPSRIELALCGGGVSGPHWTCRILIYETEYEYRKRSTFYQTEYEYRTRSLWVYEAYSKFDSNEGAWIVNSWNSD